MHGFISMLEKEYPEMFNYTQEQYNNFYGRECIFKLSKHDEDRYDHKETEWMIQQLNHEIKILPIQSENNRNVIDI
jgi:hypothetical protein